MREYVLCYDSDRGVSQHTHCWCALGKTSLFCRYQRAHTLARLEYAYSTCIHNDRHATLCIQHTYIYIHAHMSHDVCLCMIEGVHTCGVIDKMRVF